MNRLRARLRLHRMRRTRKERDPILNAVRSWTTPKSLKTNHRGG
jgi:hypothetical protein